MSERFEAKMKELVEKIGQLPEAQRGPLYDLVKETRNRHENNESNIAKAKEALEDWRIAMKYRVFDLEARVRELNGQAQKPLDDMQEDNPRS